MSWVNGLTGVWGRVLVFVLLAGWMISWGHGYAVYAADPLEITSITSNEEKKVDRSGRFEYHYGTGDTINLYIQFNQSVTCTPGGSFAIEVHELKAGGATEKLGEISFQLAEMQDPSTAVFSYTVNTSLNGILKTKAVDIPCSAGGETFTLSSGEYWFDNQIFNPSYPSIIRPVEYYIDTIDPKLHNLSILSESTKFKRGNTISIIPWFVSDLGVPSSGEDWLPSQDAYLELNVIRDGSNAKAYYDGYYFVYTVQEGDYTSELKVTAFNGTYSDYAGNVWDSSGYNGDDFPIGSAYTFDDIGPIAVDGIMPSSSVAGDALNTHSKLPEEKISATDGGSGLASVEYEWSTSTATPSSFTQSIDFAGNPSELNAQDTLSPLDEDGTYYLHVRITDVVGNVSTQYFGPYHIDYTAPAVTVTPEAYTGGGGEAIQILAEDPAGIEEIQYRWNEGSWQSHSGSNVSVYLPIDAGEHTLEVQVWDKLDNATEVLTFTSFLVDGEAPKPNFIYTEHDQPKTSHEVEIELAGNRDSETGSLYVQWSHTSAKPNVTDENWQQIADHVSLSNVSRIVTTPEGENGLFYLHVKTEDDLGNVERFTLGEDVEGGIAFLLDNTAPTAVIQPNGSAVYASEVTVDIVATDDVSDSSALRIEYSLLVEGETSEDVGTDDWLVSADGTVHITGMSGYVRVYAKVSDEAGNLIVVESDAFALDHVPPQGGVRFSNEHGHTNQKQVTVEFDAEDEITSIEVRYAVESGDWSEWMSHAQNHSAVIDLMNTVTSDGSYSIHVQYRDEAGNTSETYTIDLTYDTTAPVILETQLNPAAYTNQAVEVTVTYDDNFSPGTQSYLIEDNGIHPLTIYDLAGNSVTVDVDIHNIDRDLPEIMIGTNGTSINQKSVSTVITATDNISASAQIALKMGWSNDALVAPQEWQNIQSGDTVTLDSVDGLWFLWVEGTDEAGNVRTTVSHAFYLDNTAPSVVDVVYSPSQRTAMPVTANLEFSEPVYLVLPSETEALVTRDEVTFEENGSVLYSFVDEAGNTGNYTVEVDWIDQSLPTASVTRSMNTWTNQPVDVTISVAGDPPRSLYGITVPETAEFVSLTTSDGQTYTTTVDNVTVTEAVYRFYMNGTLSFMVEDVQTGLASEEEVQITNIDLVKPTGDIRYSTENWTNQPVTASLTMLDNSGVSPIVLGDGQSEVTFTENGTHTFRIQDAAGNEQELTASVWWIANATPEPTITFDKDSWTTEAVTATISFADETAPISITNHDSRSYTFEDNGTFTFRYEDAAGNVGDSGPITVNWIDREAPAGTLEYNVRTWTSENVTVTLHPSDNSGADVTFLNEGGTQHTFTENGSFTFVFEDEAGNQSTVEAVVDRIDKTPPQAAVSYSTTEPTNMPVRVTIEANEPGVEVLNNEGSRVYDFHDNGTFEFHIRDRAGNTAIIPVSVDYIVRDTPQVQVVYSSTEITNENVIARVQALDPEQTIYVINNFGRKEYVFTDNGSFTFIVQDEAGNRIELPAEVANIDKSKAEISVLYSETEPTQNDVTAIIQSNRELTVLNDENVLEWTFTENATKWVHVMDELGNRYWVEVSVQNIDRHAPEVQYVGGETLVIVQGQDFNPAEGLRIVDRADGELTDQATVEQNVDIHRSGEYEISFEVVDRAGNVLQFTRKAQVISPAVLVGYVNGELPPVGTALTVRGYDIRIEPFGEQGVLSAKLAKGFWPKGYFKMNGDWLDVSREAVTVDQYGYYTLLLQDQQRQYHLIHLFVIPE